MRLMSVPCNREQIDGAKYESLDSPVNAKHLACHLLLGAVPRRNLSANQNNIPGRDVRKPDS